MLESLLNFFQQYGQSVPSAERQLSSAERRLLSERVASANRGLLDHKRLPKAPNKRPRATFHIENVKGLLGEGPKEKPTPRAINGTLQEIATMVANDDKVPVDFIINEVIDPIAYHESHNYVTNRQNPGIRQGVRMNPTQKQVGGGPGRGLFQFEGKKGVQKAVLDAAGKKKRDKNGNVIMGDDSFDLALKRASTYFTNKDMQIPSWITDVQPGQDATSLTGDQQKALAILNFKGMANRPNKVEANFYKLYEKFQGPSRSDYNKSLGEFWKTYHHRKAGEEDKIKDFNRSLAIYNNIPGR